MAKKFQKSKEKKQNASQAKFRTASKVKSSKFGKPKFGKPKSQSQTFRKQPVNVVRHKG